MELDEEHVGSGGGGDEEPVGGREGSEGGGDGAVGGDLHRAHGAWEAGGAPSAPRPYCTRGPTPFKETKEKMIRKNRHKSTKSKQDYPDFFVFAFCGSAGTPSLANRQGTSSQYQYCYLDLVIWY